MAKPKQSNPNPDLLTQLWHNMVLTWRLVFDRRVSGSLKLIPMAMIAYILSPIDLLPDIFVPFGVVDDIGALVLGLQLFIRNAPPDVVAEYREGKKKRAAPGTPPYVRGGDEPHVIEGQYSVHDDDQPRQ